MSNDIRARFSGVGAIGRLDTGSGKGRAHAALSSLAGRVAEQVAHSLELRDASDDSGSRGRNFVLPSDLYSVRGQSDELGQSLGADPAQTARLNRALDRFAEACATLIAAQPAAFSIERIREVVDAQSAGGASENAESACAEIEAASQALERSRW